MDSFHRDMSYFMQAYALDLYQGDINLFGKPVDQVSRHYDDIHYGVSDHMVVSHLAGWPFDPMRRKLLHAAANTIP